MNHGSGPLTDADIVAARMRAAEGGVPWDRAKALSEAMSKAAEKHAARVAAKRRRNRVLLASAVTLLLLLAALAWFLTRRV